MKVFISWSGTRSKAAAEAIKDWLPLVIQSVEPWISTAIEKGTRGLEEVGSALETIPIGIICLTRDNLDERWIHFEAGALARARERVWTLLVDVKPSDVEPPLSQFQHTDAFSKEEMRQLLASINARLSVHNEKPLDAKRLDQAFETYWPQLEKTLQSLPAADAAKPVRQQKDILEEILEIVRRLERKPGVPAPVSGAWLRRYLQTPQEVNEVPSVDLLEYIKGGGELGAADATAPTHHYIFTTEASLQAVRKAFASNSADILDFAVLKMSDDVSIVHVKFHEPILPARAEEIIRAIGVKPIDGIMPFDAKEAAFKVAPQRYRKIRFPKDA